MQLQKRHLSFIGMFLCLMVCYVYRTTLSPSIVVMFNDVKTTKNDSSSQSKCKDKPAAHSTLSFVPRITIVDKSTANLLSAYFYGYMITNFLGALAVFVYGPRLIMIIALSGSTIFNFLTVAASYVTGYEYELIFFCRFMIGIFCGPLYSSIHELIARWSPKDELTLNAGFTHTGNIVGLIAAFAFGYFVDKSVHAWEYYLYGFGAFGVLVLVYWCLFVFDQPWLHPSISDQEKQLIVNSLYPDGQPQRQTIKDVPFISIFTCLYAIVIYCAHIANNFILYAFLTNHPKFLNKYFGISPAMASLLSIIPFGFNTVCQFSASTLVGFLQKRLNRSTTFIRKLAGGVGFIIAPIFLLPVGFVGHGGIVAAEILLSLSMGGIAFNQAGFFTQIIEISPPHASLTMGFSNMLASIPGFVTSPLLGILITNYCIDDGYKYYFIITACLTMFLGSIWIIFSSSERQYWENTLNPKNLDHKANYQPADSTVVVST